MKVAYLIFISLFLNFYTSYAQTYQFDNFSEEVAIDLANISSTYSTSAFDKIIDHKLHIDNSSSNSSMMFSVIENETELTRDLNMMFKRRHPMEKTGRILTYIGVPLAIIGGIMVAGADELYYECTNGNCQGDARGGFGIVGLAAGLGLTGTGTALWIIGSKK